LTGYRSLAIPLVVSAPVVLYQELDGTCPVLEFFLVQRERVQLQATKRVSLLAERGHELRRPHADYLEDGIYELRWSTGTVQYRILYFFHGRAVVVLAHALTKEDVIPPADLARAKERKARFRAQPAAHTYTYPGGFWNA